ncbi:hypothetical protein FDECE_8062 [Fusarium decemcellulare]|nr:hypothetical protein FDECE_8062 [Fusarium decemcellulare]
MLILIAGVTGLVGQACAQAAFKSGHQVRGLGRNPDKLPKDIVDRLESFVKLKDVYDIPALDEAVKGVDAIISAVHYSPVALVDGQILLLRAAERAGVKHSPHSNPIDPQSKTLSYFGTGDEQLTWIVLEDLAAYTIQAISEPKASDGGFYYVESFRCSTREMGRAYEEVHGLRLEPKSLGTVEDIDRLVNEARATIAPTQYLDYVGLTYMRLFLRGIMDYDSIDSRRWSHIKQTGLKELLERNLHRPIGQGN